MTKDEMKDKTKRVARFSRNYTKKFREVADILNGILDSIPDEEDAPAPKFILPRAAMATDYMTSYDFAELLGIQESELPTFFQSMIIRVGDEDLTRIMYKHWDNSYEACWGGKDLNDVAGTSLRVSTEDLENFYFHLGEL